MESRTYLASKRGDVVIRRRLTRRGGVGEDGAHKMGDRRLHGQSGVVEDGRDGGGGSKTTFTPLFLHPSRLQNNFYTPVFYTPKVHFFYTPPGISKNNFYTPIFTPLETL